MTDTHHHSHASSLERRITIVAVIVPFLGFIAALWLLWGGFVTGLDLAILAVMYVAVGFGVTIGFHRMLTHRSFEAKPWVRATFAILGSMSVQGAVIHWVADHRKHHTFTDEEGDPHSPHTHSGEGVRGVLTGLWHSHMGWLFDGERTSASRFAPDLKKDPIDPHGRQALPAVGRCSASSIPFVAGFALSGGSLFAGFTAFVWAGPRARLPAAPRDVERQLGLPHVRPPAVRERRREPRQLGRRDGLARRGLAPQPPRVPHLGAPRPEPQAARPVLRGHQDARALGLVWNVKEPKPEQIAAKKRREDERVLTPA